MRRAAGSGAVVLAVAGLVWWVVTHRAPEPAPGPAPMPAPMVPGATTASAAAAAARPADAPKAAPEPFADQDRRDGWLRYQAALHSDDPAVVFDGLRAAQECSGLAREDLSGLEAAALAAPPSEVAPRQAAARLAVARCGRFAFQPEVEDEVVQLQARLEALSPRAAEARALIADRSPEGRATFCRLFVQPEREPWVALNLAVAVQAVGFETARLMAQGLPRDRAGTVARLALERRNCQALGGCDRWSLIELMACAIHGPCGPERLSQSMFAPDDREQARRVADAWARAAADPGACNRHFFR